MGDQPVLRIPRSPSAMLRGAIPVGINPWHVQVRSPGCPSQVLDQDEDGSEFRAPSASDRRLHSIFGFPPTGFEASCRIRVVIRVLAEVAWGGADPRCNRG